jgi:hypothetical protein
VDIVSEYSCGYLNRSIDGLNLELGFLVSFVIPDVQTINFLLFFIIDKKAIHIGFLIKVLGFNMVETKGKEWHLQ